jgi:hypothetical protein
LKRTHRERRPFARPAFPLSFLCLLLFLLSGSPLPAAETPYLSSLLGQAREWKLWEDPYWHVLLHYQKSLFGLQSLVDDPQFFLSPSGKQDPRAELEATLRAFFLPEEEGKKPAVCRFVARYHWLAGRLKIDPAKLPVSSCRRFSEILDEVKPAAVTLIFPTAHINSPASMFGHTLLTVDTATRSRLLAYAINYSAVTRETFGPLFAVKGLFGFYPGYFSVLPYYAKLQEYSDIDHRDIWEYPLDLTKEEIKQLLAHVFEMDRIYSDYYFFDENCSYNLLFLLDGARPSLHLTDQLPLWVIPLDTIRAAQKSGVTLEPIYRPSRATKIKHLASFLPPPSQKAAREMAGGQMDPELFSAPATDPERSRRVFDLAGEYLQYLYSKRKMTTPEFQERFRKILQTRSRLGAPEEEDRVPPPPRPDEGHLSNRFRAALGVRGGLFFQEIGIRPAYHQLLDDDRGYIEGAQIVFGDAAVRFYPADRKLVLQKLDIIDIVSVSPRDTFFQPVSWKVKTGFYRETGGDGRDHLLYQLIPGGGISYKIGRDHLIYFFGEADFITGGGLEERYAGGVGASAGVLGNLHPLWKAHLYTRAIHYPLGDRHDSWEAGLQQNFILGRNRSLRLDLGLSKVQGYERIEAIFSFHLFF